jgi:hypothetical protein
VIDTDFEALGRDALSRRVLGLRGIVGYVKERPSPPLPVSPEVYASTERLLRLPSPPRIPDFERPGRHPDFIHSRVMRATASVDRASFSLMLGAIRRSHAIEAPPSSCSKTDPQIEEEKGEERSDGPETLASVEIDPVGSFASTSPAVEAIETAQARSAGASGPSSLSRGDRAIPPDHPDPCPAISHDPRDPRPNRADPIGEL